MRGFVWSGLDRILTQGITFVIGVLVARLLTPGDYGLVAMLTLFIAISNTFVDGGFSSALIRKADRTAEDEATVFYTNMGVGICMYLILYTTAPWISAYYHQPLLTSIARVIGLSLLFNAVSVVQQAVLISRIDFKTQTRISVLTNLISGVVGVWMAFRGMGVWALVAQTVLASVLRSLFLWMMVKWHPGSGFSYQSFKELFGYGSRILLSALLDTGYKNVYLLLIGKYYSAGNLGYYSRASQLAQFPSLNLTEIIQRVSLPSLSAIQDDLVKQTRAYRKMLIMAAFITFPVMIWLTVAAQPLVVVLLTQKWADAAVLLQILSLSMMWYPIHAINLNLLQVKGRSDWFLKLEVIKKILSVGILISTLPFGLIAMCWGLVASSLIALVINTHYTGKLLGMGFFAQMKDIIPILGKALIAGGIAWISVCWTDHDLLRIVITLFTGAIAYLLMSGQLRRQIWDDIKNMRGHVEPVMIQEYD